MEDVRDVEFQIVCGVALGVELHGGLGDCCIRLWGSHVDSERKLDGPKEVRIPNFWWIIWLGQVERSRLALVASGSAHKWAKVCENHFVAFGPGEVKCELLVLAVLGASLGRNKHKRCRFIVAVETLEWLL
jgi:hypothetical protein